MLNMRAVSFKGVLTGFFVLFITNSTVSFADPTSQPHAIPSRPTEIGKKTARLNRRHVLNPQPAFVSPTHLAIPRAPHATSQSAHTPNKKRKTRTQVTPAANARTGEQVGRHDVVSQTIVQFNVPATAQARMSLLAQLDRITHGSVKIANSRDFRNKQSPCLNSTCAIVTASELALLNQNRSSLSFQSIGQISRQSFQAGASSGSGNASRQAGPSGGTPPSPAALSSGTFSNTNPDPNTYYIPDLGYQELGQWFPGTASSTAVITSVWYEVTFYHTYPSDLVIDIGYDDTGLGGTHNFVTGSPFWNHSSGLSGFTTTSGTTNAFNGYHPDAYYVITAEDTQAQDDGYLDSVSFEVYYNDDANLAVYSPGSSFYNSASFSSPGNLTATASVINNSGMNVNTTFSIGWYVMPTSSGCSVSNFNANSAYFVGSQDVFGLNANTYSSKSINNLSLYTAQNGSNQYMPAGNYCAFAYIDDLAEVTEWDDSYSDNVIAYGGSFYYSPASFFPDLTFNTAFSSNNTYSLNSTTGQLTSTVMVKNDSTTTASGSFDTSWYMTTKPSGGCSALTTFNVQTAFFAGYTNHGSLSGGVSYSSVMPTVNLNYVQNGNSQAMASGDYCLWAFVDDTDQIAEYYEDNNILVFSQSFHFDRTPPELQVDSGGITGPSVSNNYFVSATAAVTNNSINGTGTGFNVGWYFSPLTSGSCSLSNSSLSTLPSAAFSAGTSPVNSLNAFGGANIALNLIDLRTVVNQSSQHLTPGQNYCLWLYVDSTQQVGESNETNNKYVYSTPILYTLANLIGDPSLIGSSLRTVTNDYFITVNKWIKNDSIIPAGAFSTAWYVSPAVGGSCNNIGTPSPANTYTIGTANSGALGAGSNTNAQVGPVDLQLIVNSSNQRLNNGDYCVWGKIDFNDQVSELIETDNTFYYTNAPFHFERPNLIVNGNVSGTVVTPLPNYYLNISAVVSNLSPAPISASFDLLWYLSPKPTNGCASLQGNLNPANSYPLGSKIIPGLLGSSSTAAQTVSNIDLYTVTNSSGQYLTAGDYCAWAIVDRGAVVAEGNENDNTYIYPTAIPVALTGSDGPDLTIDQNPTVPGVQNSTSMSLGSLVSATAAVQNASTVFPVSASSFASFYAIQTTSGSCGGLNPTVANSYFLGMKSVPTISASNEVQIDINAINLRLASNPQNLHAGAGFYCVWVSVDHQHSIHESDETNNISVLPTAPIELVDPDLRVDDTLPSSVSLVQAYTLTATATVTNPSVAPVNSAVTLKWYASTSSSTTCSSASVNMSTSDFVLGTSTVPSVANQGQVLATLASVNIMNAVNSVGQHLTNNTQYCVWVMVDSPNAIVESNEANNKTVLPVSSFEVIFPDLYADDTLPSSSLLSQGHFLNATATVTNQTIAPVNSTVTFKWFAAQSTATTCSASTVTMNSASDYVLGTSTLSSISPQAQVLTTLSNADVLNAVNNLNQHLSSNTQYCVWVMVDAPGVITESNESNNKTVIPTVPFSFVDPDLTGDLAATQSGQNLNSIALVQGYRLTAKVAVANVTKIPVNSSVTVKWYAANLPNSGVCTLASVNPQVNTSFYITSSTVGSVPEMASVQTSIVDFDLRAAVDLSNAHMVKDNHYCIWASIDSAAAITESDETNNFVVLPEEFGYHPPYTVGIEEAKAVSIKLFPNPTASVLNVSLPESWIGRKADVSIYDQTGRVVYTSSDLMNQSVLTIDVSTFANGVYIISAQVEGKAMSGRFTKF